MKRIYLFFIAIGFACTIIQAQTVADFENLSLPADSFWNGVDQSGGFSSGAGYFLNDYNLTYNAWSGFCYSNKKDTLTPGYANQYSAITGQGFNGSATYAVADDYGNAKIILTGNAAGKMVSGVYVTNATYTYLSMRDGDGFSKKFGGSSGNDQDWFKLSVRGWKNGVLKSQQADFYLADFRDSDNSKDYIVKNWEWLDLQPLGNVDSIQFFLSSSDTGMYGMNTPAYFCLDNFTTADIANIPPVAQDDYFTINYLQDTILAILVNDQDNTAPPLSVELLNGPIIPGAFARDSNFTQLYYKPSVGIVANDTLLYRVCDIGMECDTAMVVIRVTSLTGIEELTAGDIHIFPNPFTENFGISYPIGSEFMEIYDVQGNMISSTPVIHGKDQGRIDGSDFMPGMYFVKLTGRNFSLTTKVVKQ